MSEAAHHDDVEALQKRQRKLLWKIDFMRAFDQNCAEAILD